MITYRKTMQGRLDAFNNQSDLPQALRQLLLHVDGRTPFHRVQSYLGAQICSEANMSELVQRGYVRPLNNAIDDAFDFDEKCQANDTQHRPTIPAPLRFSLGQPQDISPSPSPSPSPLQSQSPTPPTVSDVWHAQQVLDEAKDMMSDFVLTHIPQHAFSALKEIEQITSLVILGSSVDAYELLVKPTGMAGKRHIQQLRRITEDARQSQPQSSY
jgi:hypothetical protein